LVLATFGARYADILTSTKTGSVSTHIVVIYAQAAVKLFAIPSLELEIRFVQRKKFRN
jgi:hypothetical protein